MSEDAKAPRFAAQSVYLVTSEGLGDEPPATQGVFSTRERAEAWIAAQSTRRSHTIDAWSLDTAPGGGWLVQVSGTGATVSGPTWHPLGDTSWLASAMNGGLYGYGDTPEQAKAAAEWRRDQLRAGTVDREGET